MSQNESASPVARPVTPAPTHGSASSNTSSASASQAGSRTAGLRGTTFAEGEAMLAPGGGGGSGKGIAAQAFRGGGRPVDARHADRFAHSTQADVSGAREHVGPDAQAACAELGVEGFAQGGDIAYAKESPRDEVRYHELAHYAQGARAGQGIKTFGGSGGLEQNADTVSKAVTSGGPASVASGNPGMAGFGKGDLEGSYGTQDLEAVGKRKDELEQPAHADVKPIAYSDEIANLREMIQGKPPQEAYAALVANGALQVDPATVIGLDVSGALDLLLDSLGFTFLWSSAHRESTRVILRSAVPENNTRRALNLVVVKVKVNGKGDEASKKFVLRQKDHAGKGGGDDEAYAAYQIIKSLPAGERKRFLEGEYSSVYYGLCGLLNLSQLESDDLNMYQGGGVDETTGKAKDTDRQAILAQLDDPTLWQAHDEVGRAHLENVMRMAVAAGHRLAVKAAAEKYGALETQLDLLVAVMGSDLDDDGQRDMTKKEANKAMKGGRKDMLFEAWDALVTLPGGMRKDKDPKWGGRSGRMGRVGTHVDKGEDGKLHDFDKTKGKRKDGYELSGVELDEIQDIYGKEAGMMGFKFARAGLDDKRQQKNGEVAGKDYIEDDDVNRIDAMISWDQGLLWVASEKGLALESINYPLGEMTIKSGALTTGKMMFNATFPPKSVQEARTGKDYEGTRASSMQLELARLEINDFMIVMADGITAINKIVVTDLVLESESAPGTLANLETAEDAAAHIMAAESIGKGTSGIARLLQLSDGVTDLSNGISAGAFMGQDGGGTQLKCGGLEIIGITTSSGTRVGKISAKNLDFQVRRMPSEIVTARRDGLTLTLKRQDAREASLGAELAALDARLGAASDDATREKLVAERDLLAHQQKGIDQTRTDSRAELAQIATFAAHAGELDRYAGPKAKPAAAGEEVPAVVADYKKWVGNAGTVGLLQADSFELSDMTSGGSNYGSHKLEGISAMGGGASLGNMVGGYFESVAGKGADAPKGGNYAADDNFHATVDKVTTGGGNIGVPDTEATDVRASLTDAADVGTDPKGPTKRLELKAGTVSTDPGELAEGYGANVKPIATKDLSIAVTGAGNVLSDPIGAFYERMIKIEVGLGPIHTGATGFKGGGYDFCAAGLDLDGLVAEVDVQLHAGDKGTELTYGKLHSLAMPRLAATAAHLSLPVQGQLAEIDVPKLSIEGLEAKDVPLTGFDPWTFAGQVSVDKVVAEASVGMGDKLEAGLNVEVNDLFMGVVGDEVKFDLGSLAAHDVFVDSKENAPPGSFAAMIGKLGGTIKQLDGVSAHASYDKKSGMASANLAMSLLDVGSVAMDSGATSISASGAKVEAVSAAARIELDQDAIAQRVFGQKQDPKKGDAKDVKPPMFADLIKKIHLDDLGIHRVEGNDLVYKDGKNDVTCKRGYFEELCVHGVTIDPAADKSLLPFLTEFDASLGEVGIEGMVAKIQTGKGKNDILRASLTTHAHGLSVKRADNGTTKFDLGDLDVEEAKIGTGLDGGQIDITGVLKNLGAEFTLGENGLRGSMKLGSLRVPNLHYSGADKDGNITDIAGGPTSMSDAQVTFSVGLAKKPPVGDKPAATTLGTIKLESLHVGPTRAESLEVLRYQKAELLALGTRLVDLYGFELDDKEKERVALGITKSMATKTIKQAAFDALDMKGISIDLAHGMTIKSQSFDLSGLDVDVQKGGKDDPANYVPKQATNAAAARENLRGELGDFLKLKGDLHAGKFSYSAPSAGNSKIELEDFKASSFFAAYQGVGGTLDQMKAKKLTVDTKKDQGTSIEIEDTTIQGKLDDQHTNGSKVGGLGTPESWPEYLQHWDMPLLDNVNGMVNLSIPMKNTFMDLPVRIIDGKIDTTPAWIAKSVAPHQYAIAEDVAGDVLDTGVAGKNMNAGERMKALNELGVGLLENLVVPLVMDVVGWFDPNFLHIRHLIEDRMNTQYGKVAAVDGKIPMDKSIQDMLEGAIEGMGGWSIIIDYFAPQGEGVLVSSAKAIGDWCRTWLPYCLGGRSEEEQAKVWHEKVERRARVLADVLTDVQVGDESLMVGAGKVSATRAPVTPGIGSDGKPFGDHLIGKFEPCFDADGTASLSLGGSLSSGLTLGSNMLYSSFKSDMGSMSVEGKGMAAFGQTTASATKDGTGITGADTTDTEAGVHADLLKIKLKSDSEIKAQKEHEKAGLGDSKVEHDRLYAIESGQFTSMFGRPPKSYSERSGFRELQEWMGKPSPLNDVTNAEIKPAPYKDTQRKAMMNATGMPGFVVDNVVPLVGG